MSVDGSGNECQTDRFRGFLAGVVPAEHRTVNPVDFIDYV